MTTDNDKIQADIEVIREACVEAVSLYCIHTKEQFLAQAINKDDIVELA